MTYLRVSLVVAMSGCGLISSNVTNFDLTLPDKNFSVDASGWNVNQTAAMAYLNMSCGPSNNVCMSTALQQACHMGCTGLCGAMNKCTLDLNVSVYKGVDLVAEKPELKTINDQPLIHVAIDAVTYEVTANTLNVATPMMTVYVAAMSVTNTSDPTLVKAVGTIDAVPAGTTVAERSMTFTADGKQALINIMSTFKTPFNVIVGSTIELKAGDPIPTGKLDAVVHIKAHAGV
jgi:hypothetical protein